MAVFLVIENMLQHGEIWEAIITFLAWDAYLRESDWESVRLEDIFVVEDPAGKEAPRVSTRLGSAHRGQSIKIGANHVVVLDHPLLRRIIALTRQNGHPKDSLVRFKQAHCRMIW